MTNPKPMLSQLGRQTLTPNVANLDRADPHLGSTLPNRLTDVARRTRFSPTQMQGNLPQWDTRRGLTLASPCPDN